MIQSWHNTNVDGLIHSGMRLLHANFRSWLSGTRICEFVRERRIVLEGRRGGPSSDPWIDRVISDRIRPGMVCIDVGAHQGEWSLRLAQAVGPTGHVFCFEPSPEYSGCLLTAINRLRINNITCLPIALSDAPGRAGFLTRDNARRRLSGESRLAIEPACADLVVDVGSIDTLAIAFPRIADAGFIKIDIEGAEFSVIRGAQMMLQRRRPVIYAEIEDRHCARFGHSKGDLLKFMESLGYAASPTDAVNFILVPDPHL